MAKMGWAAFPHPDKTYAQTAASLKKNWDRLHKGDREPFPKDDAGVQAWIAYHAGEFEKAWELGRGAGAGGHNAAVKAALVYGSYLENSDAKKLKIFEDAAKSCEELQKKDPKNVNAFYLHAFALGRYSQGISIAKALAQGLAGKVKASLAATLKLDAKHADAHIALGTYHAEIVNKVGAMVGGLTYGAKKDSALEHFQTALKLNPDSAIARIEYANGLVLLGGKAKMGEAEKLYKEAAACKPADAMERLDVEFAKAGL